MCLPQRCGFTWSGQRIDAPKTSWRRLWCESRGDLTLEPLDDFHASDLLHQYRDAGIATMTGLPELPTLVDVRAWIEGVQGIPSFAVVHRTLGFVGYGELQVRDDLAFLCFWIGPDFRGERFSSRAALLLCECGATNGLRSVLSSVYDVNRRSLRSLARAGFIQLATRALAPHDERTFLYRSLNGAPIEQGESDIKAFVSQANPQVAFGPPVPETCSP